MEDLIVIGGGPAGYPAAIKAAQLKAKVTLIEQGELGGTCLNVGCIPSKLYLHAASLVFELERAHATGIEGRVSIQEGRLRAHKEATIQRLRKGIEGLLKANKIRIVQAKAVFLDERVIQAGAERLESKNFLIATGSSPMLPPIPGVEGAQVWTSNEALAIPFVPREILIVGAGFIGLEMAMIFRALGAKVTLLEMLPTLLPSLDPDMSALMARSLKAKGIGLFLGARLLGFDQGKPIALIEGQERVFMADAVLLAVGREPNLEGLDVLSLRGTAKGIEVNERLQSQWPHIYAAGDVLGKTFLAHAATHQGLLAAENALGANKTIDFDNFPVPSCLYTDPEAAWIGLNQAEALRRFGKPKTGTFLYGALGRALASNDPSGKIKVLAHPDSGKILGAQIVGRFATEIIHEIGLAMNAGLTLTDIASAVHAHPSFSEGLKEACLEALGQPLHKQPH